LKNKSRKWPCLLVPWRQEELGAGRDLFIEVQAALASRRLPGLLKRAFLMSLDNQTDMVAERHRQLLCGDDSTALVLSHC
jgi:hypothetical protein